MLVCARIGVQQTSAQQLLIPNSTEISGLHQRKGVMATAATTTTVSQQVGRTRTEDFRNRKFSRSAASFSVKYSDDMHNLTSAAHQHGVSFNAKPRTCCSNNVGADLVVDDGVASRTTTTATTKTSDHHPQTFDSEVEKILQAGEIPRDRNGRQEMKDFTVIKRWSENGIAAPAKSGRAGEDLQHTKSTGFDNNNVSSSSAQEGMKSRWRKKPMSVELANRWREIQGSKKWEGLLQPALDSVLREEVVKYGEFAQATYDAFDNEKHSKYCGSSKFDKKQLLEKMGMADFGYEVTKYLYATADANVPKFFSRAKDVDDPWSKDSNWMGFIAVATSEDEIKRLGRRDIVISWRGTVTALEWLQNLHDYLTPLSPTHKTKTKDVASAVRRNVNVESGFFSLYTSKKASSRYNKNSAAEQVREEICRLVELYADEELSITITGHSLGGALAALSAFDITNSKCNERRRPSPSETDSQEQEESKLESSIPVSVFTFASPRVGNDAFRDRLEELGVNVLRVVNTHDIVPKVPGLLVNESLFDTFGYLEKIVGPWLDRLPWTYTHAGVELELNQKASPFMKQKRDYVASHSLELYLHLLDGFHSARLPFQPAIGRDIALVNRYSDSLRDELQIPSCWWQQENKGLILKEGGLWVQPNRPEDEIPSNEAHDHWL